MSVLHICEKMFKIRLFTGNSDGCFPVNEIIDIVHEGMEEKINK